MGYNTECDGKIKLSSEDKIETIREKTDSKGLNFIFEDYVEIRGNEIEICVDECRDTDWLIDFCKMIVNVDDKAEGEINCNGEEAEDIWKIVIKEGKVRVLTAKISFG